MSTVNLTEVLIRIQDLQPQLFSKLKKELYQLPMQFVPPSTSYAELAATARLKFSLNLGDCFVYALAVEENAPILTIDADFKKCDAQVIMPD